MKQYLLLKKTALAVAFNFCSLMAAAQAPAKLWDKSFGGNSMDELMKFIPTSDGGYVLGGMTESGISGDKTEASNGLIDYWIVKLDAMGNKQWDKTYGGNYDDQFSCVIQTADGGYILGGASVSDISGDKSQANQGGFDFWVVKLDANGNKQWDKNLGGSSHEHLNNIIQTADGGYILGGNSNSGISGDKSQAQIGADDYWVVKLNSAGNKVWDKTFGGLSDEFLSTIIQTADGGYIVGGSSNSASMHYDYWILKLDPNGNLLWNKSFGGNDSDFMYQFIKTADGGYILGGQSYSGISGDKTQPHNGFVDYWVVKLDSACNRTWDKTFGGPYDDLLHDIIQTADGGFLIGGGSDSDSSSTKTEMSKGSADYWIVKTDASGIQIWDKTLGGNNDDILKGMVQTPSGGYVLGGWSASGISGDHTQGSKGGIDYWIANLGTNFSTDINESTSGFNFSVSPNPSRGKFLLQLNNLTAKTAAITVSDLVGRIVYQQEIPVTGNQIQEEINLQAVKGMYILQVKAGTQTSTRKIVIE